MASRPGSVSEDTDSARWSPGVSARSLLLRLLLLPQSPCGQYGVWVSFFPCHMGPPISLVVRDAPLPPSPHQSGPGGCEHRRSQCLALTLTQLYPLPGVPLGCPEDPHRGVGTILLAWQTWVLWPGQCGFPGILNWDTREGGGCLVGAGAG